MWDLFVFKFVHDVSELTGSIAGWLGEHLLNIVIILVAAYIIRKFGTRAISGVLRRTLRRDLFPTEIDRKKRIQTLESLIGAVMRVAVWLVAFIMIIDQLGINTAPLLASAGVLGVALGFGAQSLIKDMVSGIFIITENQYRVGDVVQLDSVSGVVETVTVRTTVLRDLDGKVHHIPNGSITITTNMTDGYAQVNENIMVGYDTDIAKLEHIINHVGQQLAAMPEYQKIIVEPPHFERVEAFGDNGVIVKVLARTMPGEQWRVKGQLYKLLKKSFEQHDIEIPFPQLVLHDSRSGRKRA